MSNWSCSRPCAASPKARVGRLVRWSLHSLPSGDVNALENTQTAKGTARTMHVAQPVPRSTSGGNPMVCRMERLSSKDSEAKGSAMVFWNWPNSHNATASALCL